MNKPDKRIVIFDLWETLVFGTKDSAVSMFYKEMTGAEISQEQLKSCMLINESSPRAFLEKLLSVVTPANHSSMLLSLKSPRSPLYNSIMDRFNAIVRDDLREMRWLPGAVELLESLKGKYRLVLVSNLLGYQKEHLFRQLKLDRYFDRCLFSCDTRMNKNDMLKRIGTLLGADPSGVLYVGRSYEHDIVPAVAASLSAVRMPGEDHLIFPAKTKEMIDEEFDCSGKRAKDAARGKAASKPEILLVIPPFYKLLGSHNNRINLGASHISSYLAAKGFPNKIYHCDYSRGENYITRYQMVFNSIEFYKSLEKHKSFEEFERFYAQNKADIVFVTCGDILNPSFDSGNWDSAKKTAKIVRRANPGAFIVAVGPETGGDSEDFDLLIHGEAENLLEDIVARKIRGIVRGTLLPESELENFPAFDFRNILPGVSPVSLDTIIWRRGCVGRCDFCRVAQINNGRVRRRNARSVIEEMKARKALLKLKNFYIVDANFTSDKESVMEFCGMIKRDLPGISWRTESRFDTLDEELLWEMKNAGCTHLKLGLENALHEKHQVKTKKININDAKRWVGRIKKIGIKPVIYLMLGGKWFTPGQYRQMYENAEGVKADGYTVSLFNPYPNTPAGITQDEWDGRRFIGSHLDIRLVDFWKIPIDIVDLFFTLELKKGREDKDIRKFIK